MYRPPYTVDWDLWMEATPQERERMLRRYREIVRTEIDNATRSNWRALTAALAGRRAA
jgi:hypothetical protein